LIYQEEALGGKKIAAAYLPSAERYTLLLELNGQKNKAYDLLLEMAKIGQSSANMNAQLKRLYIQKNGEEGADEFFASVNAHILQEKKTELQQKILDFPAPVFSLRNLEGKEVALADFKGKIVVLDFWATWCAPCKASFPAMQKLMTQHPEVAFLFIATNETQANAPARIKSYIHDQKYPFQVLLDEPLADAPQTFRVVSAYKPEGIPAKVVIDKNGMQRFLSVGFSSDTELLNEMEAMIALAKEQ